MKTKNMAQHGKKQHGFTLIELIIVIVLLGIVGTMGASFINQAFRGFFDTDIRMEMYEEGKTALVRMEREIHIAVPNAVIALDNTASPPYDDVINSAGFGNAIIFGEIDEHKMADISGQYTDPPFTDSQAALPAGTHLVSIYNTRWNDFATSSSIYTVTSTGTNPMTVAPAITMTSPYGRYYAVRNEAVRFSVANGGLTRSTALVTAGANLGTFGSAQTLAQNIIPSGALPYFTYEPGTSTRNSVVVIHFAIHRPETNETVNFHKEVQIRNVP